MTSPLSPQMDKRPQLSGSPYCADPECKYCKELRRAQEQLMQGKALVASSKSA